MFLVIVTSSMEAPVMSKVHFKLKCEQSWTAFVTSVPVLPRAVAIEVRSFAQVLFVLPPLQSVTAASMACEASPKLVTAKEMSLAQPAFLDLLGHS